MLFSIQCLTFEKCDQRNENDFRGLTLSALNQDDKMNLSKHLISNYLIKDWPVFNELEMNKIYETHQNLTVCISVDMFN